MSRRVFVTLASVLVLASPAAAKSHHGPGHKSSWRVERGVASVPHHGWRASAREQRRADAGRTNARALVYRVVWPDPYAVDRHLREQAVQTFFTNGPAMDGFGCNYNPFSGAEGFCLPR